MILLNVVFLLLCILVHNLPRARDMNGKAEEFWTHGDFGYVKKEVDTLKTLCKPQIKVGVSVKRDPVANQIHSRVTPMGIYRASYQLPWTNTSPHLVCL